MTLSIDQISTDNGTMQREPSTQSQQGLRDGRGVPAPAGHNPWHVNVHPAERLASVLVGGVLVGRVIAQPSPLRMLGALGGVMLLGRGVTGHCYGYSAMNYSTAHSRDPASPDVYFNKAIHLESAVTIARPAHELYAYWRQFSNLPSFMEGLESVTPLDETGKRTHWIAKAPAGTVVQWEAEIVAEETDRLIAWRSLGNADVDNAGSVRFLDAPGNRGTEVRVVIDYVPPGGILGKVVAKLFGRDPQSQVHEDLRRFKQLMEAGELPTVLGQPQGGPCR
jgi:uncharacterized membrane protein